MKENKCYLENCNNKQLKTEECLTWCSVEHKKRWQEIEYPSEKSNNLQARFNKFRENNTKFQIENNAEKIKEFKKRINDLVFVDPKLAVKFIESEKDPIFNEAKREFYDWWTKKIVGKF